LVAVEEEDDGVAEAAENGGVAFGECGAEGGDDIFYAVLVAGDDIGVAFDDDGDALSFDGSLGVVEAIEGAGFVEDEGFGAVEIFGVIVVVDAAATEGDDATDLVADGEDEAVAHGVVLAALIAGFEESGVCEGFGVEFFVADGDEESVPSVGTCSYAEFFDDLWGHASAIDQVACHFAMFWV